MDCRPGGVTEELKSKTSDAMDATLHWNERMLRRHQDRRRMRVATPTK
jgi:hypothetical protein